MFNHLKWNYLTLSLTQRHIENLSKRLKDWPIQLRDELEQWSSFHNLLGGHLGKRIAAEKLEAEKDEIMGPVLKSIPSGNNTLFELLNVDVK